MNFSHNDILSNANGNKYELLHAALSFDISACMEGRSDVSEAHSTEAALAILGRIGVGYLILDAQRKVIDWNPAAQMTLERQGEKADTLAGLSSAFRRLTASLSVKFPPNSVSWMVIPSRYGRPVVLQEQLKNASEGMSIVVLVDRDSRQQPNPETLQRMFGLTNAETQLALSMVSGDAPLEIARNRRLSRTTIRSQLASLFTKTETKRQAELVSLLCRMSILP